MPLSSQMHTPKLMTEDDVYIKYSLPDDEFEGDGQEIKDTEDGVTITMAKRKADGQMGVVSCSFKKSAFDQKKASDWIAAQKFSLEPADMHSIKDVEIFSTGLWNGKQIDSDTLDAIVDSFSKTQGKVRPFLKLGHDEDQKLLQSDGLPAAGWIENVRKVGSKLVADFVDIPKKIYQLIKNNAYRKVSCEIYNNIEIDGKAYPKLLGAVALLGADLPGVLNLNDILSMYCTPRDTMAVEKFAAKEKAVIIISNNNHKDGAKMPEQDVEKFKLELAAKDAEIEKYKNEAAEAQKKVLDAAKASQAAKADAFVSQLQSDKICSKAMAPLVRALVGEEMDAYSIEGKELSKAELVKAVLEGAIAAGKVNFTETTKNTTDFSDDKNLDAKIEKYASENKVTYGAAYRAVTKGIELPVKSMGEQAE